MTKVKNKIISWKYLFVAIPIVLYALSNRQSMSYIEEAHHVTANIWDYVFMSVSDPYIILFYFFPLIIYISTVYVNRTFEYIKLIRIGSYKSWVFTKLRQLIKIDIFFMLIFLGSILLTTLNIPFSMEWSGVGKINVSGNEILYYTRMYFNKPFIALIFQIGLFLLTTITFQLFLCIVYAKSNNTFILHVINGLMYIYNSISFKLFPPSLKLIIPTNYLCLFHGIESFDSIIRPFIIVTIVLMILILITYNIDLNYMHLINSLKRHLPILVYVGLCLLGILFNIGKFENDNLSVWEGLIVTFIGTTNESFDLISFLFYVIVFIGIVYLVQLKLEVYLSELSFYTMIRYRSTGKWFLSWFTNVLKMVMIILSTLSLGTIAIAALKGYSMAVPENIFEILYQFMVNGFLQLLFYILLVIIISFVSKDVIKSFITILALTICMLPGFRINNLVPVGLNSMAYILEGTSIIMISIKLMVCIAIEVIVLQYLFNKKDYIL